MADRSRIGPPPSQFASLPAFWSALNFTWATPIIDSAVKSGGILNERDAYDLLLPDSDDAPALAKQFDEKYESIKERLAAAGGSGGSGSSGGSSSSIWSNATVRTLLALHWQKFVRHVIWMLIQVAVRLLSPVALRDFLLWLQSYSRGEDPAVWRGWMLAVGLGACGLAMCILNHQLSWIPMRMGNTMRQQCISAIHAKALRLNAASIASVSSGHVVNLVSTDVRRFDDGLPYWVYLIGGPIELALVLLMVSLELGFLPALAGISATLLLIPVQAALVRPVAAIRRATAHKTDERVRLTGEVIQGALAMKMLSWEGPLTATIQELRAQEVAQASRMAQIRSTNLALSFAITPLVSFVTFAVKRSLSGTLDVPTVFYSLSLLTLPKLYMVQLFTQGVQTVTELRVSLTRINDFLSLPEPPLPVAAQTFSGPHSGAEAAAGARKAVAEPGATLPRGTVALRGADYDWARPLGERRLQKNERQQQTSGGAKKLPAAGAGAAATRHDDGQKDGQVVVELPPKAVRISGGAAADHHHRHHHRTSGGDPGVDGAVPVGLKPPTLHGVSLHAAPGQLIAVVGEVGAGKSSLLAALLGELQPLPGATGSTEGSSGGPVVCGRVAYCTQVPWIVAGTIRDNITFGRPYDEKLYASVLSACALDTDIAGLAAGDLTELGERGINLSGGQKARVALARAAYSRADVQLLDDPLSAVDPRVGRILFKQCIGPGGIMEGSTRLLVTHQRQYLPLCDRLLVLRGGQVVAEGSYEEIAALGLPELTAGAPAALAEVTIDEAAEGQHHAQQGYKAKLKDGSSSDSSSSMNASSGRASSGSGNVGCDINADGDGGRDDGFADSSADGDVDGAADTAGVLLGMPPAAAADGGDGELLAVEHAAAVADEEEAAEQRQEGEEQQHAQRRQQHHHQHHEQQQQQPHHQQQSAPLQGLGQQGPAPAGTAAGVEPAPEPAGAKDAKEGKEASGETRGGQLVVAEDRARGSVSMQVYLQYMRHMGVGSSILIWIGLIGGQAVYLASDWWLALWSKSTDQGDVTWLWVYAMLTAIVLVVSFVRSALFFHATLQASTSLHHRMISSVLRAPLSFFHTNPAGRILNRFSKDLSQVDDALPNTMFDALQIGFIVLSALVLVSIAVPVIVPVFVPLAYVFYLYRQRYVTASREIKRWEGVTRSPVFAAFSATLKGLPTIRAYASGARFHAAFLTALSLNGSWSFAFIATAKWIGYRLDLIAASTLLASALLAMAMRSSLQPQLLALALSYVLQLTRYMQWVARQSAEVENHMTSVERMLAYTSLPREPPLMSEGGGEPPKGWPRTGRLQYDRVSATYRPGLPVVLRDISFELKGGSSCGVVGRTGSGKSSLMLTLFRLIDVTGGTISLDGLDISKIGLDALRKQLAIIPQDPVLFSGTLRSNLDPWDTHTDAELYEVLSAVKLKAAIKSSGGLHARMAEAGDNLSVGQRQLFCLARALLQRAQVLALDEATANVDRATDALIQGTLRRFAHGGGGGGGGGDGGGDPAGRVLLVIAHRIDTIMDCDHLLVLSSGWLVEQGPPAALTAREGGMFAGMVAAAKAAAAGGSSGSTDSTDRHA